MKKTLKTLEVLTLYNELSTLSGDQNRRLPGNISWAIYRTFKPLKEINDDFEKMRNNKINEMYNAEKAVLAENNNVQIKDEYMTEFMDYINGILFSEVEVELHMITQESFDKLLDTCDLSIPEVEGLEKLVKGE